jgi:hypothetical protein
MIQSTQSVAASNSSKALSMHSAYVAGSGSRKPEGGARHRRLARLTIQIVAPASGVKAAGPGERPQHVPQRTGTTAPQVRNAPSLVVDIACRGSACLLAVLHLISTSPDTVGNESFPLSLMRRTPSVCL